ncbi:MAG: hypothetical protein C4309_13555 [Chloroflexota bacterium]
MLASIEWHGLGSWRATLNGGGVEVHFNSVSGDLILTTDDGRRTTERVAAPAAPVTEAPEPPPMTTMDVLKAVEAGQMTVDEALRRLNKSA